MVESWHFVILYLNFIIREVCCVMYKKNSTFGMENFNWILVYILCYFLSLHNCWIFKIKVFIHPFLKILPGIFTLMICFFHSHIELFLLISFNNYHDHNFAAVVITICIRILANGQNDCPKILRTQGLEENPNCTNGQRGSNP